MAGFDDFNALGDLVHPKADKPGALTPRASSPAAELQLKLLKSIVGDSLSRVCVKMITAYESKDGTTDVTELEKILNNPSAKLISREMHWGSTVTTDGEGGSASSPCLTMLVTYSINDYSTMLTKIEEYSMRYRGKETLTSEAAAIVDMLITAVTALKAELSEIELRNRADGLITILSDCKKTPGKDLSGNKDKSDDKTEGKGETAGTSAKKKKTKAPSEKQPAVFRVTENVPTSRTGEPAADAVADLLRQPEDQVTVFEVVADAEKEQGSAEKDSDV